MGGFSPRGVRQPSCSGVLGADGHNSISMGRKERERAWDWAVSTWRRPPRASALFQVWQWEAWHRNNPTSSHISQGLFTPTIHPSELTKALERKNPWEGVWPGARGKEEIRLTGQQQFQKGDLWRTSESKRWSDIVQEIHLLSEQRTRKKLLWRGNKIK